ncbi:MAG: DUF2029 domain-containing protein [Chloroflexi bacterium]|nr:DUF2029 domain-containing protein [Chloroflexota bacterium]
MVLRGRTARLRLLDRVLLVALATGLVGLSIAGIVHGTWGYDAYAYWAIDPVHPYAAAMNVYGAYLYSPAFAQLAAPLGWLPYPVFLPLWTGLLLGALAWLGRGWAAVLFLVPFVFLEVLAGNIQLLIAGALVLGFRWPASWAFILLTKLTPGVGLLWFAARREWRAIGIALGVTVAIAGCSFVLAPGAWSEWLERLAVEGQRVDPGPWAALAGPLWARLAVAAGICVWAGSRGLRWPLAVAVTIALPNPSPQSLSVLVALVPLIALDRERPLERRPLGLSRVLGRTHATAPAVVTT